MKINSIYYSKTYDQNGIYQAIVDLTYLDCGQLWKDQFIGKGSTTEVDEAKGSNKRHFDDISEENDTKMIDLKKRRVSTILEGATTFTNTIDK